MTNTQCMQVTSRPSSLVAQRSELYEGLVGLEQDAALGVEVVERELDLEDVVLAPYCCVCLWQLPASGTVRLTIV
jgi:hypothetical protein